MLQACPMATGYIILMSHYGIPMSWYAVQAKTVEFCLFVFLFSINNNFIIKYKWGTPPRSGKEGEGIKNGWSITHSPGITSFSSPSFQRLPNALGTNAEAREKSFLVIPSFFRMPEVLGSCPVKVQWREKGCTQRSYGFHEKE